MTEAEALAIAMRAIVSAFVTAPAPAPAAPPPARTPSKKPRRKRKPAAPGAERVIRSDDLPPMPATELLASEGDLPPVVTLADLDALMNGRAPDGTYAREEREEVGGGWAGPQ